jgi:hypothetical protein
VVGASEAIGRHLTVHPRHWYDLADPALAASRPSPDDVAACLATALDAANPVDALRVEYRRLLLRLAARDLAEGLLVDEVAAVLADLAGGALETALRIARKDFFASHPDAADCRLAIIAMGKCGGRELNYVSDVDVLFVAEPLEGEAEAPALKSATQLAAATMRICSLHTAEGTLWPVDAALRPEGKAGPLVRTVDSHLAYYQRWAKTWEFQALLKARPIAGAAELGRAYTDRIGPLVWAAADREGFVDDVQAMRRRVVDHLPAAEADRQLKLGPGGLRDVEFAVQLLQLVHGRSDESVRSGTTLVALEQLTTSGYVGRTDGAMLADAYRFLRSMEHRIQLHRLRRTHQVPADADGLRRLGRSLGFSQESRRRPDQRVEEARAGGQTAAREAFLPPVAGGRGPHPRRRGPVDAGGRQATTHRPRVRRPGVGAAAHRGAVGRGVATVRDPEGAAPGHARLVRGVAGPGRGAARVPDHLGRTRLDAVVPAATARRGRVRGTTRTPARQWAVRGGPAPAGTGGHRDAGGRAGAGPAVARRAADGDVGRRSSSRRASRCRGRGPWGPAAGTVPDRRGGPVRVRGRRGGRGGADGDLGGHADGRAGGGPADRGQGRPRAHPDGDRGDGTVRGTRARLRQ